MTKAQRLFLVRMPYSGKIEVTPRNSKTVASLIVSDHLVKSGRREVELTPKGWKAKLDAARSS